MFISLSLSSSTADMSSKLVESLSSADMEEGFDGGLLWFSSGSISAIITKLFGSSSKSTDLIFFDCEIGDLLSTVVNGSLPIEKKSVRKHKFRKCNFQAYLESASFPEGFLEFWGFCSSRLLITIIFVAFRKKKIIESRLPEFFGTSDVPLIFLRWYRWTQTWEITKISWVDNSRVQHGTNNASNLILGAISCQYLLRICPLDGQSAVRHSILHETENHCKKNSNFSLPSYYYGINTTISTEIIVWKLNLIKFFLKNLTFLRDNIFKCMLIFSNAMPVQTRRGVNHDFKILPIILKQKTKFTIRMTVMTFLKAVF